MPATPIKPLGRPHRQYTFLLLLALFCASIPLLYLYATGYRVDLSGETGFISTGGIFISAERTGAEIYIDDELVRETRVFRRAFYAQNLDPGTHRVHVQREGTHTWVKELPVYAHLVTEAQAFNLPLAPEARAVTRYMTDDGTSVLATTYTLRATTTQQFLVTAAAAAVTLPTNPEFSTRLQRFATPTPTRPAVATSTATTTKESNGVRLYEEGGDVFASWVGPRESMPYYYCAESFPRYSTSTEPILPSEPMTNDEAALALYAADDEVSEVLEMAQEVAPEQECKPSVRLDRKGEKVSSFDFFPGTTDIAIVARESGVYAVEIDDRAWQNVQPIMEGAKLRVYVENDRIYIYDGVVIYDMILE